jgi:hypothetical protein
LKLDFNLLQTVFSNVMRFDVAKVVNMTMFRTTFMSLDAAFQNKDCKKHVQQISKPVNLAHFDWICTGTNPYNKDIYWLFTLTFWSIAFFLSIFFFLFSFSIFFYFRLSFCGFLWVASLAYPNLLGTKSFV